MDGRTRCFLAVDIKWYTIFPENVTRIADVVRDGRYFSQAIFNLVSANTKEPTQIFDNLYQLLVKNHYRISVSAFYLRTDTDF